MDKIVSAFFVWGIAAILLALIYRLYRKKKLTGKQASFATLSVFIVRGTLVTILGGTLLYDIYISYIPNLKLYWKNYSTKQSGETSSFNEVDFGNTPQKGITISETSRPVEELQDNSIPPLPVVASLPTCCDEEELASCDEAKNEGPEEKIPLEESEDEDED